MSAYSSLPTTNGYSPLQTKTLLARLAAAPPTRIRRLFPFIAVLVLSSTLVVYFVFSSIPLSFSSRPYSDPHVEADAGTPAFGSSTSTWTDDGPGSPFFRDTHPALHARLFLARAPSSPNRWWPYPQSFCAAHHLAHTPGWGGSLQDHGLFTGSCDLTSAGRALKDSMGGEVFLGSEFIEPDALLAKIQENNRNKNGGGRGGAGACAENITHPVLFVPRQDRWNPFHVGEDLVTTFLALTLFSLTPPPPSTATSGSWLPSWASSSTTTTTSSATSADLLTALPETYFSLLSPASSSSSHSSNSPSSPSANATSTPQQQHQQQLQHELTELTHALSHTASLQLVFSDKFIPSENLFAPLWDRIGGRVPRRMGLEGLGVDGDLTCLSTSFHSVGAGASLLSATRVGERHTCASELVWGASLWLRWVWGLEGAGPFSALSGVGGDAAFTSANVDGRMVERGFAEGGGMGRRDASWDDELEIEEREREKEAEKRAPAPVPAGAQSTPIQVLFLSREKFDLWTKHSAKSKKLTPWQEARHIANEPELVAGLRAGLAGLCRTVTPVPGRRIAHTRGAHDCTYTDADALPSAWGVGMHGREATALGVAVRGRGVPVHADTAATTPDRRLGGTDTEGTVNERRDDSPPAHDTRASLPPRALRFATLDPTTSALATQLGAIGRADVVVSVHAGALGLSLFLPTGRASVVELVTTGAQGNHHFHNMAHMMGMQYRRVDVKKTVDVSAVVRAVREVVEERLER